MARRRKGFRSAESAKRRRSRANLRLGLYAVAALLALFGFFYLLYLPAFSVERIAISGNPTIPASDIEAVVREHMAGRYAYVFPKRSILFVPTDAIGAGLLAAFPRVARAQVSRSGFSSISVTLNERTPVALWCGGAFVPDAPANAGTCAFLDETGYVFDVAPSFNGTSLPRYYGPLTGLSGAAAGAASSGIGGRYLSPEQFRTAYEFMQSLSGSGVVAPIAFSTYGESDFKVYLRDQGSIVFAAGENANRLIASLRAVLASETFAEIDLSALDYIDLRFGDKVYYRFKGAPIDASATTTASTTVF